MSGVLAFGRQMGHCDNRLYPFHLVGARATAMGWLRLSTYGQGFITHFLAHLDVA